MVHKQISSATRPLFGEAGKTAGRFFCIDWCFWVCPARAPEPAAPTRVALRFGWVGAMAIAEELRAIGFGKLRREPVCWRAVRLGPPIPTGDADRCGAEPACSRALLQWRDLLARSARPSPYRISRASD